MFTPNPFQHIRTLISGCALKVKQYLHVDPVDPDPGRDEDHPIALQCPAKQLPTRRSSHTKCRNMSFRLNEELHRKIARQMPLLPGTRADFIRNAIDRALQEKEALLGPDGGSAIRRNGTISRPARSGLEQVPGIAILSVKRRKITFRLDDALHQRICRQVPSGRRSEFIRNAIERALKQNAEARLRVLHRQIDWG